MSATPVSPTQRKQILRVIFISLLLDLISFTFILPLYPKLLEFYRNLDNSHDSSSLLRRIFDTLNTYKGSFSRPISDRYDIVLLGGALGSLFSLLQAIASPIIGTLSDKYGRRTALLWSMAGNIASVALWVAATDFRTFLASRVVGGLSEGNVQLAIAMAADISDDKKRGATMALVGVCFSIAFTFGPALGAALANIETVVSNPFATAAGFSLFLIVLETIYLYFHLPETLPSSRSPNQTNGSISTSAVKQEPANQRTNSHLLLNFTHFAFILFFSGLEFSLPFMTYDLFAYSASQSGRLLGFMGLIAAVLQGSVTRRLHPLRVVQLGVVCCAASFFLLGRLSTERGLWTAATLLAVTTATVVTGLNSLSSFEAGEGERGGKLGNHRSWGQVGRSLGPLLFCTLYWWAGRDVAYGIGGAGMLGYQSDSRLDLLHFTAWSSTSLSNVFPNHASVHYVDDAAMTQAHAQTAFPNNIIDLTEEDDNDDGLEVLNQAASKAQAAATRLTTQFESYTAAARERHFSPRNLSHAELPSSRPPSKPPPSGSKKVLKNISRPVSQTRPTPSTTQKDTTGPESGLKPAKIKHKSPDSTKYDQPMNPNLVKADDGDTIAAVRPSRAAAQSAGRLITGVYESLNPLEAQLEAQSHTRRKPGRPKIDQWTPASHSSPSVEKIENWNRDNDSFRASPTHGPTKLPTSGVNVVSSDHVAHIKSDLKSENKRKRAAPSASLGPSLKYSRNAAGNPDNNGNTTYMSRRPSENSFLPMRERARGVSVDHNSSKTSHDGNLRSSPGQAKSKTSQSNMEKISDRKPREQHETSMSAPEVEPALRLIFDKIVYPAIRETQGSCKDQIPESDFFFICQEVSREVIEHKLYSISDASFQPKPGQEESIKDFVRKCFDQKVLDLSMMRGKSSDRLQERLGQTSSRHPFHEQEKMFEGQTDKVSTTVNQQTSESKLTTSYPSNSNPKDVLGARPEAITNLSNYLKKLEDETLPANLDIFRNHSPVGRQASPPHAPDRSRLSNSSRAKSSSGINTNGTVNQSTTDKVETILNPSSSPSVTVGLKVDLSTDSESSWPPGYDRGRYPAQRRKRGNKYYNPGRPSGVAASGHRLSLARSESSLTSESSESTQQPPEDLISRALVTRITTDPEAKALVQAIASGTASPTQIKAFQELTDKFNEPTMSLGRFIKPRKRRLDTAHDPELEGLAADLLINPSEVSLPANRTNLHFVTYKNQRKLLKRSSLFEYPNPSLPAHEQQLWQTSKTSFTRIETKVVDPSWRPIHRTSSLLRYRELGSDSRAHHVDTQGALRLRNAEKLEAWRYWKGASGDIVAAAWGPDSTTFAVGAAAHTNAEDVQYNRPCNLLFGDLIHNTLTELPDHRVDRPKPNTLGDTYNARQAVYDACDPMVYETVASVAFSPRDNRMYTASHDCTVKIWDTTNSQTKCLVTFDHGVKVTSVDASTQVPGLFATACNSIDDSIRMYYAASDESNPVQVNLSSSRAQARKGWRIYPECIHWGSTPSTKHLLLAGLRSTDNGDNDTSNEGQLCLWDANTFEAIKVLPSSQAVFAAAWHPFLPFFATGGTPGGSGLTSKRAKTVVRTWDLRSPLRYTMEYECPASDFQDITFSPGDSNIVTAGCTDGTSFVWDYRKPNYPLHRLKHGDPLVDWDHSRGEREEVDTGVMLSLWGLGGTLFYTGSSDGMIKAWDVRRHPADVLIRNVAQFGAGVQSGALSPDSTNMLVGDADGGVHVLSSAPCGTQPDEDGSAQISPEVPINLVRAPNGSGLALQNDQDNPGTEGREEAQRLTASDQIKYDTQLGVTQGEQYQGPYAHQHRKEAREAYINRSPITGDAESKHFFLRTRAENEVVEEKRRGLIAARKQRIAVMYPNMGEVQEESTKGPASAEVP